MDDNTIQTTLGTVAPVQAGQTIGQVIDAGLTVVDSVTLKQLIDAREQDNFKAAVIALCPAISAPANAAAIYAFLLGHTSENDYATAYLTLKRAAEGASANPPTKTWDDVWKALLYLTIAVRTATPHLEGQ